MSETIDKTKRPELKVTDDLKSSAQPDESCSDASATNVATGLAADKAADKAAEPAPKSPKDSEPADADGTPALPDSPVPHSGREDSTTDSKKAQKAHSGLTRHRLIIGACLSLSLLSIPLSTVDLRGLVKQPATVNTSFQIEKSRPKPKLPPNFTYRNGDELSEGLIQVVESTWNGNVWGFADESGKVVIKPQFGWVGDFHEGLAPAKTVGENGLAGFINKSGTWVIKPQFESAFQFHDGVAEVAFKRFGALIDKTGRILAKSDLRGRVIGTGWSSSIGNLFLACHKGQYGLVDKTGKWVVPAAYDSIREFETGYQAERLPTFHRTKDASQYVLISTNRLWGVADATGKIIIPPRYEEVLSFQNGHAAIKVDGKYGFVDSAGKTIIDPRYDFVTKFDDLIAVSIDGHWQFINSSGKILNVAPVDGIISDNSGSWLSDGYGVVVVNKLCGYMDRTGHIAIPPRFELATEFKHGYALVWDGLMWRFIDKNGNFVSPSFAEASQFADGKSTVAAAGPLYRFMNAQELENEKSASDIVKDESAKAKRQNAPESQGEDD